MLDLTNNDEDFARELQRQEFMEHYQNQNYNGQIVQPPSVSQQLLPNRGGGHQVRGNIASGVYEASSYRFVMLYLFYGLMEMIGTTVILALYWDVGTTCLKPLHIWILAFSSRFLIQVPLHIVRYRAGQRDEHETVHSISKYMNWINIFTFLWFIVGNSWIYGSYTCKSSPLYTYCLVVISIIYLGMLLPVILVICICLCTPCFLICWNYFGGQTEQGANRSQIRNLTRESTYQASENTESEEPEACSICMNDFESNAAIRTLPCEHFFHPQCIDQWLTIKRECPLCRHDITEAAPQRNEQNEEQVDIAPARES